MFRIVWITLLTACLTAVLVGSARAGAEDRIEGRVLKTEVTYCGLRPRGCAGFLVLEAARGSRRERLTVEVRLEVPIRDGDKYVYLASLGGSVVSVVHVIEKGALVAVSIEVIGR